MIKVSMFERGQLKKSFLSEEMGSVHYELGRQGYIPINHPKFNEWDMVYSRNENLTVKIEEIDTYVLTG